MYGTKTTRSIHNRQALTYGDMLSQALIQKFEEMDPLLIDDTTQVDAFHDQEDYYTDYVRKQIVDRRLEEPWLESDIPSRSDAQSRSILNLRYKGVRGCITEPVRHPELSLGFLGNDPRGKQIGPDINKISKQIQQRKTDFTIGMGSNANIQVPERS